jgi:hypothetical protein
VALELIAQHINELAHGSEHKTSRAVSAESWESKEPSPPSPRPYKPIPE